MFAVKMAGNVPFLKYPWIENPEHFWLIQKSYFNKIGMVVFFFLNVKYFNLNLS